MRSKELQVGTLTFPGSLRIEYEENKDDSSA